MRVIVAEVRVKMFLNLTKVILYDHEFIIELLPTTKNANRSKICDKEELIITTQANCHFVCITKVADIPVYLIMSISTPDILTLCL